MLQDEDEPTLEIEVSGPLNIYGQETSVHGENKQLLGVYDFSEAPERFRILGKSRLNHSVVLIDMYGEARFWIDLDQTDVLNISEIDLARVPTVDQRGRPVQTSEQTVTPTGYVLQSFVVDESVVVHEPHDKSLGIELSDTVWADRTPNKIGVLSRDFNPIGGTDSFQLQSPVIGPDVRVEFVVTKHETLGNYVVISFPAAVYQTNETIMRHLAMQHSAAGRLDERSLEPQWSDKGRKDMQRLAALGDHNPDLWREDGRIFYAFAHLSEIASHIQPGQFIDSQEKTVIGKTGSTGTAKKHLDLAIMYFGSSEPGSGAMNQQLNILRGEYKRTGSQFVRYFFGLGERSQLYWNNVFSLYGENLDPVRIHPELDELKRAEYLEGGSIYAGE